jgi:hypothetical protein
MGTLSNVALGALALAAMSIAPAKAGAITWDLSSPSGLLGDAQNYTAGSPPITIRATGFINGSFVPGNETALFGKAAGGDEQGLGLNDDPSGEHEINGTNWVQLNVTNAVTAGVTGLSFIMDSVTGCTALPCTAGDSWRVFGSNSATSLGVQLPGLIGFDEKVSHPLPSGFDFFNFQAVTGNVLITSISGTQAAIPEPSTWAMMLLGFAGLGFGAFRRSRKGDISIASA